MRIQSIEAKHETSFVHPVHNVPRTKRFTQLQPEYTKQSYFEIVVVGACRLSRLASHSTKFNYDSRNMLPSHRQEDHKNCLIAVVRKAL
jgi:hypothetical protein